MLRPPDTDIVKSAIISAHGLDHSWTFRIDVGEARGDGSFTFTAEVVREHEAGGRFRWFCGAIGPAGASSVEALEPHSFGPEGPDEKVFRARRRAIGRRVLDEDSVHFAEAALRKRMPDLPRWPITRTRAEHIEGNATVFDFATLVYEGQEPRVAIWYVGRVRVDLDTYVSSIEVHEHPRSRSIERWQRTPSAAHDEELEEAWFELGFPKTKSYLPPQEKLRRVTEAIDASHPPDHGACLGHVNIQGEADESGSFHFAAEAWVAGESGGRVHGYSGVIAPLGASKIERRESLVYGTDGIDGVALRRLRSSLNLPLLCPTVRRSMSEAELRGALRIPDEVGLDAEIRTTDESTRSGLTRFSFAALLGEGGAYTGKISYELETNTFSGDVEKASGDPSWPALGVPRAEPADNHPKPRDIKPPTRVRSESALLAAVAARPEDDAPRLELAARLEARRDPRGELIRLQCTQARSGNTRASKDRVAELLRAHEKAWTAAAGIRGARTYFLRGWPKGLIGSAADILASRDALRTQPIETLYLTSGVERWRELMAIPELSRVGLLEIGPLRSEDGRTSPVPVSGLEALVESQNLRGLRELKLFPPALDGEGARVLARAPWLSAIETLVLAENPIDGAGFTALVPRLVAVRRLVLDECTIGPVGAEALARSAMRQLDSLSAAKTAIDDAGVIALAASTTLACVTHLDLRNNRLGDEAAIALARSPHASRLRELNLAVNGIGPKGAEALASSTALASLEMLDLTNNNLGHAGVDALAAGIGLQALRRLAITRNGLYTGEYETFDGGSYPLEETPEQLGARFGRRPGLVIS